MKTQQQIVRDKVFMNGVWKHKYNEGLNEIRAEVFNASNDRTAYDVGEEPEFKNFDK